MTFLSRLFGFLLMNIVLVDNFDLLHELFSKHQLFQIKKQFSNDLLKVLKLQLKRIIDYFPKTMTKCVVEWIEAILSSLSEQIFLHKMCRNKYVLDPGHKAHFRYEYLRLLYKLTCRPQLDRLVNKYHYKFAGTLCNQNQQQMTDLESVLYKFMRDKIPKQFHHNSPTELLRVQYEFWIAEFNNFHLNMSFVEFSFSVNLLCLEDFVRILDHSKGSACSQKTVTFCGTKSPFYFIFTSGIASVVSRAALSSYFTIFYPIMTSQMLYSLHFCQTEACEACRYVCGSYSFNNLQNDQKGIVKELLSHVLVLQDKKFYIVYISVRKLYFVQLEYNCTNETFIVLDGPSLQSPKAFFSHGTFLMSSFQVTVILSQVTFLNQAGKFSFKSVLNRGTEDHLSQKKLYNFTPVKEQFTVFKTVWLKQPQNASYKLEAEFINYTGAKEVRDTPSFGGICVCFVDESGEVEEIVTYSDSFSKHDSNTRRNRKNEHAIVSRFSTKFVVIIHHYNFPFSLVTGQILVSETPCVGHMVQNTCIHNGMHHKYQLCFDTEQCNRLASESKTPLRARKKAKCVVMSLSNQLIEDHTFYTPTNSYFARRILGPWIPEGTSCLDDHETLIFRVLLMIPRQVTDIVEIQTESFMYSTIHELLGEVVQYNLSDVGLQLDHTRIRYENSFPATGYFWSRENANQNKLNVHAGGFVWHRGWPFAHFKIGTIFQPNKLAPYSLAFYSTRDNVFDAWASIYIRAMDCQNNLTFIAHLFPHLFEPILPKSVMSYLCEGTGYHRRLADLSKYNHKLPHQFQIAETQRIRQVAPYTILSQADFMPGDCDVYLETNFSGAGHAITLTAQYQFWHHWPVVNFTLPALAENSHILIPSTSAPRCILCIHTPGYDYSINDLCHWMQVVADLPMTAIGQHVKQHKKSSGGGKQGEECFDLQIAGSALKSIIEPHILLQSPEFVRKVLAYALSWQCQGKTMNCANKFLSWTEAEEHCQSRGLHLPSVHSTRDMEIIQELVSQNQCQKSRYVIKETGNLKCGENPDLLYGTHDVMYQTIEIYIGLKMQVR